MAKAKAEAPKKSTKAAKTTMTKVALIQAITEMLGDGVSRKDVKATVEALAEVGHKELKKNGLFVLPGFAKFVVVKKPARPAQERMNPFTKQMQVFPAKPASKSVKARPVKAVKAAVA